MSTASLALQDCLRTGDSIESWQADHVGEELLATVSHLLEADPVVQVSRTFANSLKETVVGPLLKQGWTVPLLGSNSCATALQLVSPLPGTSASLLDANLFKIFVRTSSSDGYASVTHLFGCQPLVHRPTNDWLGLGLCRLDGLGQQVLVLHAHGDVARLHPLLRAVDFVLYETEPASDPPKDSIAERLKSLGVSRKTSCVPFNPKNPDFSSHVPGAQASLLLAEVTGKMDSADAPACIFIRRLLADTCKDRDPHARLRPSLVETVNALSLGRPFVAADCPPDIQMTTAQPRPGAYNWADLARRPNKLRDYLVECLQLPDMTQRTLKLHRFVCELEAAGQPALYWDLLREVPFLQPPPAKPFARHLLDGWPVELLSGGRPNLPWLATVFSHLGAMISNSKVAVVSAFFSNQQRKAELFAKLFGIRPAPPPQPEQELCSIQLVRAEGWSNFAYVLVLEHFFSAADSASDKLLTTSLAISEVALVLDQPALFLPKLEAASKALFPKPKLLVQSGPDPLPSNCQGHDFSLEAKAIHFHRRKIHAACGGLLTSSIYNRLVALFPDPYPRFDEVLSEARLPSPLPPPWCEEDRKAAALAFVATLSEPNLDQPLLQTAKESLTVREALRRGFLGRMRLAGYDQEVVYYKNLVLRCCEKAADLTTAEQETRFEALWVELLAHERYTNPEALRPGKCFISKLVADRPKFLDLFTAGCQRALRIREASEKLQLALAGLEAPVLPFKEASPLERRRRPRQLRQALLCPPTKKFTLPDYIREKLSMFDSLFGQATVNKLRELIGFVADFIEPSETVEVVSRALSRLTFRPSYGFTVIQDALFRAPFVLRSQLVCPLYRACPTCLKERLVCLSRVISALVLCQHCATTYCPKCLCTAVTEHDPYNPTRCKTAEKQRLSLNGPSEPESDRSEGSIRDIDPFLLVDCVQIQLFVGEARRPVIVDLRKQRCEELQNLLGASAVFRPKFYPDDPIPVNQVLRDMPLVEGQRYDKASRT